MSKTLKVTCSGSFKASDGDIESFDSVTGLIPSIDEDKACQMVIRRYAKIWIGQVKKPNSEDTKYKRVNKVCEVFIDSIEENDNAPDAVLSYVGKDIMQMNFEELQDFAAANDLSAVPLYKSCSLQHARRVAWSEAARKIYGNEGPEFVWTNTTFNPSQHGSITADAQIRRSGEHVADIEETIDRENLALSGKAKATVSNPSTSRLSIDQLRAIADEKKVTYHKSIGYEALYAKVYGAKKVA